MVAKKILSRRSEMGTSLRSLSVGKNENNPSRGKQPLKGPKRDVKENLNLNLNLKETQKNLKEVQKVETGIKDGAPGTVQCPPGRPPAPCTPPPPAP